MTSQNVFARNLYGNFLNSIRRNLVGVMAAGAAICASLAYAPSALAVPPAFTIIGPKEWDLPIAKPGHGVTGFFQSSIYTDDNRKYGPNGHQTGNHPQGHTFLGLSRIAHVFSFKSLPGVGFFWEYLQPEVYTENSTGHSLSGLGDPLVDGTIYFRPVKSLMIGLQNIVSVPVGENNLSHHFWEYEPNIITDYQLGHFGIDNTVGVGIKSDRHNGGTTASVGSDIYEDLRLRYQITHYFTPFVSYDYAKTNPGHYTQVDHSAGANSNVNVGDRINGSYQDIAGAGGLIYLKKDQSSWLDIWYNVGFAGKNTTRVNGIFSRFVYLF